ncbi:unnamed protein product [Ilex paraguariensis]|uniref:Thioredoxin domain-containing protein n=1 Tax=Ilex paraguariensis TaxID=185542 RepID=A0ABC8RHR2_9AQUA
MVASIRSALLLCFLAVSSLRCVSSSSPPPPSMRHQPSETLFFNTLQSQCPLSYSPNSPLEVNGDFLDRTLAAKWGNAYTSILFYASWCPFSHNVRLTLEVLGSMFPEIEHLAVEQSLAMPSMFSRYGVHSFPMILLVNQTSRMRFRGSKDLLSLVIYEPEINKRTIPSTLYIVPLFEGAYICVPKSLISFQRFLGIIWTPSKLGNIWKDKPNVGASISDDQREEDLDQAKSMQDQELPSRCQERTSVGFFTGFCLSG